MRTMMRFTPSIILLSNACVASNSASVSRSLAADGIADRGKTHAENPRYWPYKGQPVMLLGESKTDYICCSMTSKRISMRCRRSGPTKT
jgi:hypothetical protein